MMPNLLYLWEGKLLTRGGKLAIARKCCCGDLCCCDELPDTLYGRTAGWEATDCEGGRIFRERSITFDREPCMDHGPWTDNLGNPLLHPDPDCRWSVWYGCGHYARCWADLSTGEDVLWEAPVQFLLTCNIVVGTGVVSFDFAARIAIQPGDPLHYFGWVNCSSDTVQCPFQPADPPPVATLPDGCSVWSKIEVSPSPIL